jgi:hypothetical protein
MIWYLVPNSLTLKFLFALLSGLPMIYSSKSRVSETVNKFNDDGMKVVIKYCFKSESGISLDRSSPHGSP